MFARRAPVARANTLSEKRVVIRHLILPENLENTNRVIDWVSKNVFTLRRPLHPHEPVHPLRIFVAFPSHECADQAEYDAAVGILKIRHQRRL